MAKSRIQREKAKHRTGLIKYLTRCNAPHKQEKQRQENQDYHRRKIAELARRMGIK